MKAWIAAAIVVAVASPALAESPADRMLAQLIQSEIKVIETVIFAQTQKTPTVLHARRVGALSRTPRYCGEAMLGSSRRAKFVIDMETGIFAIDPKPANMAAVGCNDQGGQVLVDMR